MGKSPWFSARIPLRNGRGSTRSARCRRVDRVDQLGSMFQKGALLHREAARRTLPNWREFVINRCRCGNGLASNLQGPSP
jgi:hypothetical protein